MYEDPQCPACARFEAQSRGTIAQLVESGTAQVRYHVVSFLDAQSTSKYSSRAAGALYCSADAGVFQRYHELLFANQPAEGTAGLTDDQLIAYGSQAGVTDTAAFTSCVRDRKYADFVAGITDEASRDGIASTPAVLVDGNVVQPATLANLTEAVRAAT